MSPSNTQSNSQEVEIATLKAQMTAMSSDVSDMKSSMNKVSDQVQQLLLSWESAKSQYVSREVHSNSLQNLRSEMTEQLNKHAEERSKQYEEIQQQLSKLNSVYLKAAGAGIVIVFLVTQYKAILSLLSR